MENIQRNIIREKFLANLYSLGDVQHTLQQSKGGILHSLDESSTLPNLNIYIKYMVSLRCKMVVEAAFVQLHIPYITVSLGMVEMKNDLTPNERTLLKANLLQSGLELMDDKRTVLIEKIKQVIIEMIHYADELPETNYPNYIAKKMQLDYKYLSNIFSEVKGITIQHFIILHKIEKAKELLLYDELSLTEIAYKLHYSSVAHLSTQFKKVTGLSPSYFKVLKELRNNLENL